LQGPAIPVRSASVLKERQDLLAFRPDGVNAELCGREGIFAIAKSAVDAPDVVQPRFPEQDVKPQLLMEKLDDPYFRGKRVAVAVRRLTQLHDPGVTDRGSQAFQVREIFVRGVDAS